MKRSLLAVLALLLASPVSAGENQWTPLTVPPVPDGALQPIGVATLPADPPALFTGGGETRLVRSRDGGLTWVPVGQGELSPFVELIRSAPGADRILYISGFAMGLVESRDLGASFTDKAPPGCVIPLVLGVAPSDPLRLYVSGRFLTTGCGLSDACNLLTTADGGATWECIRGDGGPVGGERGPNGADDFAVDPREPRRVWLAGLAPGPWVSEDAGATWVERPLAPGVAVHSIESDPKQPDVLYTGTFGQGLWKSTDRGQSWSVLGEGLPDVPVVDLVLDPVRPETLYAVAQGVGVFASDDGGATFEPLPGLPVEELEAVRLAVDPLHPATLYADTRQGLFTLTRVEPNTCLPGPTTLCLQDGRFEVKVVWQDFDQGEGLGRAVPRTADSGYFWFFGRDNVEVVVKVLDGRSINDSFWVFYGSLSNVQYTLLVTDTATGRQSGYFNGAGRFASVGDVRAFPETPAFSGAPEAVAASPWTTAGGAEGTALGECAAGPQTLCLADGRFEVTVAWGDFTGGSGVGRALPETDDTGFFWFFEPNNVELAVKIHDGRPLNDAFWFFYGALSNVSYEIRVRDTETGRVRSYVNPSGTFGSRGDTRAFPDAGGGMLCDGIAGIQCPAGQRCEHDTGSCLLADAAGICEPIPEVCPEIFQPVCGCDGVTYENDCFRKLEGVQKDHDGACP